MSFVRGQWVYVDPDAGAAPRELRGLAGQVVATTDGLVTVALHQNGRETSTEVEAAILLPDRRRRNRPPAEWPASSFAQPA